MWHSPHKANAHSIGWRVMLNTPRAVAGAAATGGPGNAGLPSSDPISSTLASSITSVTGPQIPSPTAHSGAVAGAAR